MEKTNLGLAKWSLARVGWPYWYGTTCNLCTEALLKRKAAQFPEHYGESRMPRYRSDIAKGLYAADCSGLIKGYWWD
ncbi:MAG: hypothetical protein GX558_06455, partial [Clostridiales bacterium]|nr:hypothetical protein [Clostridiales bacterium]